MKTCGRLLTAYLGCAMVLLTATAGLAQNRPSLERERDWLVDRVLVDSGITDPRVMEAMRTVPRHEFVPLALRKKAYYDMSLPIGESQTISPPFDRGLHDRADPAPAGRSRAGDRHRQRLPGGRAQRAGPRGLYHRDRRAAGTPCGKGPQATALRQRPRQGGRRLPGLAAARPVRQDHRHLLAREASRRPFKSSSRRAGGW